MVNFIDHSTWEKLDQILLEICEHRWPYIGIGPSSSAVIVIGKRGSNCGVDETKERMHNSIAKSYKGSTPD